MAALTLSDRQSRLLAITTQAHALIDQFLTREKECPDRAWEPVVELQQLLEQLQALYPAKTFRSRAKPA
jgi:hypothetical protein